jgi:hypothetical protein
LNQTPPTDPETLLHTRRVRDALSLRLLQNPDVSLVDIGLDPLGKLPQQVVVRVHIRSSAALENLEIPEEVDGVVVRVVVADYRLE